jgi:hypothetical protein
MDPRWIDRQLELAAEGLHTASQQVAACIEDDSPDSLLALEAWCELSLTYAKLLRALRNMV